ncbi:MAG: ABC transporter ATP-binding protein [Patescibacteria group bacterium]
MKQNKSTMRDVLKAFGVGIKPHWVAVTFMWLTAILAAALQVFIPLLYKEFFDILSQTANRSEVVPLLKEVIFQILFINVLFFIALRTTTFCDSYVQNRIPAQLKQTSFNYLINHSYTFFSNNFGGSLVQKVGRYTRGFNKLMDSITWSLIPITVNVVGVGFVLWKIEPRVASAMLVWAMLFLGWNYIFARYKSKYDILVAEADSKVTGRLADVITNSSTVQLFTANKYESDEFSDVVEKHIKLSLFTWRIYNVNQAIQSGLIIALEFFVFYIAIRYWEIGVFSVGTFVLIQAYILGLTERLWGFARVIRAMYESYADAKEMVDIFNTPHEIQDIPGAHDIVIKDGIIEFKDLEFSYNQTRNVLNKINLHIKSGEKVALIGPSGAGKSTFVRLIMRLYEITGGEILIDDQNIAKVTQESLRSYISLVPQDPILFHRSLKENIRYGRRDATDEEVIEAAKLSHSHEFIKDLPLGYDTLVGERGIKLSGGERQRIAIARAILKNAPILILDEATSSLDSESESYIQEALDVLMKGKTTIVIAHRLSTIRKMDRIIVVDGGQILEQGSHDELLTQENSLYKKLWNLQAGGFLKDQE